MRITTCVLITMLAVPCQASESISNLLERAFSNHVILDGVQLSTEEVQEAIAYAKEKKEYLNQAGRYSGTADLICAKLGDPEIMQRYIEHLQGTNYGRRASKDARAVDTLRKYGDISYMGDVAPLLYLEESAYQRDDDFGLMTSRSASACEIVKAMLLRSDHVDEELKNWIEQLPHVWHTDNRATMRAWWEQNKEISQSGQYDKMRPLLNDMHEVVPPLTEVSHPQETVVASLDHPPIPVPTGSVSPGDDLANSPPPIQAGGAQSEQDTRASFRNQRLIGIASFCIFILSLLIWRKRRMT